MSDPLQEVADLIELESGIRIKEPRAGALEAALARVSPGMDAERFLRERMVPGQSTVLLDHLVDQVTVQETFFMREPQDLEAIDWHQLLNAAHGRGVGEINVWVCACASGEEAYSVAMLASEAFGHGRAPVSVLATDISPRALRRVEEGTYSERSTRDLTPARRERFLVEDGPRSRVGSQLRALVRTRRHNLIADPMPPPGEVAFDLILCRNVLIYFGTDTVQTVVNSLEGALRPGGQLILGASDRLARSARRLDGPTVKPATLTPPVLTPGRPRGSARAPESRKPRSPRTPNSASRPEPPGRFLGEAVKAANAGEYEKAIELAGRVLAGDPLHAEAYYVRGISEQAMDDLASATGSLRRALYVDPNFALAAFQLGRTHDRRGDERAARRAYTQTLRALDSGEGTHPDLHAHGDVTTIEAACRARLSESQ